jgi:AraC-like DNA-binding protein
MFLIIGIIISFFLGFLLLSKKNKNLADKILMTWLFILGFHLLLFYIDVYAQTYQIPFLMGFELPLPLIQGPFLFLYVATLTNQLHQNKWINLSHFLLPIAFYIYLIPFFLLPLNQKIYVFENQGAGYELFTKIGFACVIVSGIVYVIWSWILLRRHKKNILDQFSYQEKINLDWLQYLIYGMGLIWIVILLRVGDNFIFFSVVLFVLFIGYFGIKQVGIFTVQPVGINHTSENQEDESNDSAIEKVKYAKSRLTEETAHQLHTDLKNLMATEKLFKEPELTLSDLATRLNIHPNYLSQVINEKEGVNFYDYVNSLRIEEFIQQIALPENKKYTLLTVAYEAGFNSKSSFNRYFKKVTDQSPSEYLRNMDL